MFHYQKTAVENIRVDENQDVTYLINGVWTSARLCHKEDIQNYYNTLLGVRMDKIQDFHTQFCHEKPEQTEYNISYKDQGQINHVKVGAPYLHHEFLTRITRLIPPIAKFKLVHESYKLTNQQLSEKDKCGVMIDINWKQHDFRLPMCWMIRLETITAKKFYDFVQDINTSEEMSEIIMKIKKQSTLKATTSKSKFMTFLLDRQSSFKMKRVKRQQNGCYSILVKIIDQNGNRRQLVGIMQEDQVQKLNESQKTDFDRLLKKGLKRQNTNPIIKPGY